MSLPNPAVRPMLEREAPPEPIAAPGMIEGWMGSATGEALFQALPFVAGALALVIAWLCWRALAGTISPTRPRRGPR